MPNRSPSTIFFILLAFTVLTACSDKNDPSPPTPSASTTTSSTTAPAPLTAVPLPMPTGLQASYSYGPSFATLRPVNFTITVNSHTDFTHSYRYQDCAACDADVRYRMAPDGSWAHAEFPCLLPPPDTRATE